MLTDEMLLEYLDPIVYEKDYEDFNSSRNYHSDYSEFNTLGV